MAQIDELVSSFSAKQETQFLDLDENKKAFDDFCYLVQQSHLGYRIQRKHVAIFGSSESDIADCAVIYANANQKFVQFPKSIITRTDEKAYVSVVVYDGDDVQEVYMFSVNEIMNKNGFLSLFKDLKKEDMYQINISKKQKLNANVFGQVLKQYIM